MLAQDDTAGREIDTKDKRTAKVLWWVMMATRLVIPAYVIYAIYLYWTLPPSAYLMTGN
ncbi:MAG TPA: hypothetical protein VL996_05215 [Methylocella sp.]|nr:hypothetical protein [Methylocella sp.]